jgi:hypothetical protein
MTHKTERPKKKLPHRATKAEMIARNERLIPISRDHVFPGIFGEAGIPDAIGIPDPPRRTILPGLFSDDEIADRFGMTTRSVRERARKHGIRRRPLFLTEAEALKLMEPVPCLKSSKGARSGMSEGRSVDELSMRLQRKETKQALDDLRKRSKPGSPGSTATNVLPLASRKPPRSI